MTNSWTRMLLVLGVMVWIPVRMICAEEAVDKEPATRERQIEDMKNAFEEITESFRQRVLELERSGTEGREAARVERETALAERDAARAAAVAERDSLIVERDAARERCGSLEEIRQALDKEIETLKADLLASQASVQAATSGKDAEIARLREALETAQAANAKERFALAYNLGNIYKATRAYARAEAEFLKAMEMNANDSALHYNMGILYDDNLGDRKKARYHYERFLELAPKDPDAPNVVKWLKELDLK